MGEFEMEEMLRELLMEQEGEDIDQVRTFEESGVMTGNKGLEVTMEDGSRFQLTIIQSR